jgi:hypothetical protein
VRINVIGGKGVRKLPLFKRKELSKDAICMRA